jgi:hypothetical protein
MSEMPKSVKVGPFVYSIGTDVSKIRGVEHEKQMACAAYTDRHMLEIHIDSSHALGAQRDSLWHEIKHCVCYVVNYSGKLTEESMIETTTGMELAVLRDNPDVVAFLTSPDGG